MTIVKTERLVIKHTLEIIFHYKLRHEPSSLKISRVQAFDTVEVF